MSNPKKRRRILPSLSITVGDSRARSAESEPSTQQAGEDEWWQVANTVQSTDGTPTFGAISIETSKKGHPDSTGSLAVSPPVSGGSVSRVGSGGAFAAVSQSNRPTRHWDFGTMESRQRCNEISPAAQKVVPHLHSLASTRHESQRCDASSHPTQRTNCAGLTILRPNSEDVADLTNPTPRTLYSRQFGEPLHRREDSTMLSGRGLMPAATAGSSKLAVGDSVGKTSNTMRESQPDSRPVEQSLVESGQSSDSMSTAAATASGSDHFQASVVRRDPKWYSPMGRQGLTSLRTKEVRAEAPALSSSLQASGGQVQGTAAVKLPRHNSMDIKADNPFAAVGAPTYRYVCLSRAGPKRELNEDAYMVTGELLGDKAMSLYAVFDGHGGDRASRFCAKAVGNTVAGQIAIALQEHARAVGSAVTSPSTGPNASASTYNASASALAQNNRRELTTSTVGRTGDYSATTRKSTTQSVAPKDPVSQVRATSPPASSSSSASSFLAPASGSSSSSDTRQLQKCQSKPLSDLSASDQRPALGQKRPRASEYPVRCVAGTATSAETATSETHVPAQPWHSDPVEDCLEYVLALAMKRVFVQLDEQFRSLDPPSALESSTSDTSYTGAAALMAVCLPGPARLLLAHVGDCRAIVVQESGTYRQLTVDHTPDDPKEADRIRSSGGSISDGRVAGVLNMTRSIGDSKLKPAVTAAPRVSIYDIDERDDWLILATDGLWSGVSNRAAARTVAQLESAEAPSSTSTRVPLSHSTGSRSKHSRGFAAGTEDQIRTTTAHSDTAARAAADADAGDSLPTRTKQRPSSRTVAGRLLAKALLANSADDVTVLVVDLKARS